MSHIVKVLVVANPNIESEEIRDAIVQRAAAGPVHVTLIEPSAVGAGPLCAPCVAGEPTVERMRQASAARLERAVVWLQDAGVAVEGIASATGDADRVWDPSRFDEIVVSCVPWVSLRTRVYTCDSTAS
jgi:hypothetical protein